MVDDDPAILEAARLGLERSGWEVETVDNGDEALAHVEKSPPDLVLLDIMMPGLDGREVLARIRDAETDQRLPVVALSARHDLDSQLVEMGVTGVMRKPFDPLALSDVLLSYLS